MDKMRVIEIDLGVHKLIEAERSDFSESANDVLRRLLKLGAHEPVTVGPQLSAGRDWSGKGVTLPPGTEARMEYNGRVHLGRIENGRWMVEGKDFGSPSGAAGSVAITKRGSRTKLDGWTHWHVKRPSDTGWIPLNALRRARSTVGSLELLAAL